MERINQSDLARASGISVARIRTLTAKGVIQSQTGENGRVTYDQAEALAAINAAAVTTIRGIPLAPAPAESTADNPSFQPEAVLERALKAGERAFNKRVREALDQITDDDAAELALHRILFNSGAVFAAVREELCAKGEQP